MKEKRLTAKQVADQLLELAKSSSRQSHSALTSNRVMLSTTLQLEALTFSRAGWIVAQNLIPRWQDEPDGDGWYWVEGVDDPVDVWMRQDGSWAAVDRNNEKVKLGRVCPIVERPEETA